MDCDGLSQWVHTCSRPFYQSAAVHHPPPPPSTTCTYIHNMYIHPRHIHTSTTCTYMYPHAPVELTLSLPAGTSGQRDKRRNRNPCRFGPRTGVQQPILATRSRPTTTTQVPIPSPPSRSHASTSSPSLQSLLCFAYHWNQFRLLLTTHSSLYISLSRYIVYRSLSFTFFFFPSLWSYAWQPIALLHLVFTVIPSSLPSFLLSFLLSSSQGFYHSYQPQQTNTQSTATQSHNHRHDEHPSSCSLHAYQSPTHPSSWRTVRFSSSSSSSNFAKTDFITIFLLLDSHPLASSLLTNRPRGACVVRVVRTNTQTPETAGCSARRTFRETGGGGKRGMERT